MSFLFDLPQYESTKKKKPESKLKKLKKGQTLEGLADEARRLVEEKLGKYKDKGRCCTNINDLKSFFEQAEDIIGIDTETTRLLGRYI